MLFFFIILYFCNTLVFPKTYFLYLTLNNKVSTSLNNMFMVLYSFRFTVLLYYLILVISIILIFYNKNIVGFEQNAKTSSTKIFFKIISFLLIILRPLLIINMYRWGKWIYTWIVYYPKIHSYIHCKTQVFFFQHFKTSW